MSLETAIRAPRGTTLRCRGWHQEAALRMLHNNLDPEVAEKPEELIVYGGTGRAARDWPSLPRHRARAAKRSKTTRPCWCSPGKPGRHLPHPSRSPARAASPMPTWWATGPTGTSSRASERLGLTMYGQMTAGSWIYIGSQGIVQGTYETFAALARKHFGGSLAGKLVVSGGMGGMGGAQPLAATMNGACFLGIDVDPARIQRRLETGYCDRMARTLDEALRTAARGARRGSALSVGLVGNCADVLPELVRRGIVPDVLTDQTSAHDPLNGYVPNGMTLAEARAAARARSRTSTWRAPSPPWACTWRPCSRCKRPGAVTFDYGNNIRTQAANAGVERAFDIPGFVPEYIRPLFCEGRGPFRWVALSGDPADIYRTDRLALRTVPARRNPGPLDSTWRAQRIRFQGLPARICWLGYGERAEFGLAMNAPGAQGRVEGAHRDRPRSSRHRLAWPRPSARPKACATAPTPSPTGRCSTRWSTPPPAPVWVSIHNGGGVGIGYSQHAGMVVVADGSDGDGAPPGARAHHATPASASSATPMPATPRRWNSPQTHGITPPVMMT